MTMTAISAEVDEDVERRECCAASVHDDCEPDCPSEACAACANERALDADADAYFDRG